MRTLCFRKSACERARVSLTVSRPLKAYMPAWVRVVYRSCPSLWYFGRVLPGCCYHADLLSVLSHTTGSAVITCAAHSFSTWTVSAHSSLRHRKHKMLCKRLGGFCSLHQQAATLCSYKLRLDVFVRCFCQSVSQIRVMCQCGPGAECSPAFLQTTPPSSVTFFSGCRREADFLSSVSAGFEPSPQGLGALLTLLTCS